VVQLLFRASGITGGIWFSHASKTGTDTLAEHTLQHSHRYFSDRFTGSITNKVSNVIGAIEQTIPDLLWAHLNSLIAFLVTYILISTVDVTSGLLFLALLVVLFLVNRQMAPKKATLSRTNAEAKTDVNAHLVDTIGNISAVRQYTSTRTELERIHTLTNHRRNTAITSWLYTERMLLINSTLLFLFAFAMFWLLIERWGSGVISTGDFVLVLALLSQITGTLLFIGRAFNTTAKAIGEMREGLDDIYQPHEIKDAPDATTLSPQPPAIAWHNVTFEFNQVPIFQNFSLEIPAFQRVGLVGPSGAGKTTFVSLLLREHELSNGHISIAEQDIATVTQNSLREAIAVVPQEPALFHRTIRENIAYANPDASDAVIEAAAKQAHAHDFITNLPAGYDTLVGERGIKLSGGQRQRIAIARALLKDAPILLLDEATSALDSESEAAIQEALQTLMKGKTVIAIAHRLSTLQAMDRLIILDEGKIVEDGTHHKLKEANGLYQKLWEHQAGGFLSGP